MAERISDAEWQAFRAELSRSEDSRLRPEPLIPTFIDRMTPREAWNAALDALEPMLDWEAFWNDGRNTSVIEYRVGEEGDDE